MVKLTERLVLARSRASDLEIVRKLNCWASELTDVSIIRKMSNVQIVSLSVNQLSTLKDFSASMNLEELYIRKNVIKDLEEIWHLRKLPRLRVLWLADNPCATGDKYRMTVLKTLPNLQRLDNVPVTEEEVNEAIVQGIDLEPVAIKTSRSSPVETRRLEQDKKDQDLVKSEEQPKELVLEVESGRSERKAVEKDTDRDEQEEDHNEVTTQTTVETDVGIKLDSESEEKIPEQDQTKDVSRIDATSEKEVSTPNLEKVEMSDDEDDVEEESVKENDEESLEEGEVVIENPYRETNEIREQLGLKPVPEDKVMQPEKSRPSHLTKIRNSNILQAVLHLIKELDIDSLEIVSDAIRDKLDT